MEQNLLEEKILNLEKWIQKLEQKERTRQVLGIAKLIVGIIIMTVLIISLISIYHTIASTMNPFEHNNYNIEGMIEDVFK